MENVEDILEENEETGSILQDETNKVDTKNENRELIMNSAKTALNNGCLQLKVNISSFTGNNLRKIMNLLSKESLSDLNSDCVKSKFKYCHAPVEEVWRISSLQGLLQVREGRLDVQGFSQHEIE